MVSAAVSTVNKGKERLVTAQKQRRLQRETSDAQKAIELDSKRFAKEMTIEIRRQNMDVINQSTTRLLTSMFDKRRFEKKKRRFISRDSKSVQKQVVEDALVICNIAPCH